MDVKSRSAARGAPRHAVQRTPGLQCRRSRARHASRRRTRGGRTATDRRARRRTRSPATRSSDVHVGAVEELDVADPRRLGALLVPRAAERLSSSGTSTSTAGATRAASRSSVIGSGTCSSTCESTARSYGASSAGTLRPSNTSTRRATPRARARSAAGGESSKPSSAGASPRAASSASSAPSPQPISASERGRSPAARAQRHDVVGLRARAQRPPAAHPLGLGPIRERVPLRVELAEVAHRDACHRRAGSPATSTTPDSRRVGSAPAVTPASSHEKRYFARRWSGSRRDQ